MKVINRDWKKSEDRGRFSELLTELNIPFPRFGVAETAAEASALADQLDFPLLVRPSYVLGGQGMKIVINGDFGGFGNVIEVNARNGNRRGAFAATGSTLLTAELESILHTEFVLFDSSQELFYFIFFGVIFL